MLQDLRAREAAIRQPARELRVPDQRVPAHHLVVGPGERDRRVPDQSKWPRAGSTEAHFISLAGVIELNSRAAMSP
jgi:hypothetical protein